MNSRPTFEDQLQDLLEDGPAEAPSQLLDTVLAAVPTIQQRRVASRFPWRTSQMNRFARVLTGIAAVVVVASAALFVASRPIPGGVGGQASPSPAIGPSPTLASPLVSFPEPTVVASPSSTVAPTTGPCDPAQLAARITLWEGAAGHRIAHLELANRGSAACTLQALARPQLLDGKGSVVIDGAAPSASTVLTMAAGQTIRTLVQDGNYCGPTPAAPVTVAFILADGGRIVAAPLSPSDATVPPCLGAAGSAGDIEMQPWAP